MSGICAVWRRDHPEQISEMLASRQQRAIPTCDGAGRTARALPESESGVSARFATQQVYQDPHVMIACDADLA